MKERLQSICSLGIVFPSLPSMETKNDFKELLQQCSLGFEQKPALFVHIAMKHPYLWKYFYFEMLKVHSSIHAWNDVMDEAYKFSEYYNTTSRTDKACLPSISMDKVTPVSETIHLTDTLQK